LRFTNHFILDFESNLNTAYWGLIFPQHKNLNTDKTPASPLYKYHLTPAISQLKPSQTTPFSPNLININFLRKERLYTKLKYSRSPAYDIVSGGTAAILAGFLGFLVSEKFGFELADSGDFYYLLMYVVLLAFSVRPLLVSVNNSGGLVSIFSLKYTFYFSMFILTQIINKFKKV
jgi:hypothetical protein